MFHLGMDERIVAVMGATGCGKSKLINLATGDGDSKVGHSLKSGKTNLSQDVISRHGTLTICLQN
jgi:ABC-type lipoprotein export system ATPase subunit